MKRKLFIAWAVVHLCYIVVINLISAHFAWCDFNHKKHFKVADAFTDILYSGPLMYYGRYTGAETGYGFFGINVRSNGMLVAECDGKKLFPAFKSSEASLRFFSLSGALTDNLLSKADTNAGQKLMADFNELAIKNIAVKLYNDNHCSDTSIEISYNLLEFPALKNYRINATGYTLTKIKTFQFVLKNAN